MTRAAAATTGRALTFEELLSLPVAIDLVTAGRAWGIGRTKAHELARSGEFPCPVLRLGNAYRVTRADLLRSLGIDPSNANGPVPPDQAAANTLPSPKGFDEQGNRPTTSPGTLR